MKDIERRRMVRIGSLAIVETAADKANGVYRHVDGYVIEGEKMVALNQESLKRFDQLARLTYQRSDRAPRLDRLG